MTQQQNVTDEKKPIPDVKHESETPKKRSFPKYVIPALIAFTLVAVAGGIWYWMDQGKYVYSEKASIQAPLIQLTPKNSGILMMVLIHEGDTLRAHQPVARIGSSLITTEVPGVAITVKQDIGAQYLQGQSVVTMIEPKELRVIASIEEDKGLSNIHVGQDVLFTVDAYGSQQFHGTVEEVRKTNRSGDVVFNISDKREEQEYDVKIKFDQSLYPQFRNGMSARVWIIK